MSLVFGGIHDPREDHKLDGSLFRYSSPPMDFQGMLIMPILQRFLYWATSSKRQCIVKRLLFDAVITPVRPLSFVSFTNRLTILRSCEAPTPFTVNVKLND